MSIQVLEKNKMTTEDKSIDFSYSEDFWILTLHYRAGTDIKIFRQSEKTEMQAFVNSLVFNNEDCTNFSLVKFHSVKV